MGIRDLWYILTPHSDRKPISELRGKIVAIDLAGWVCESLNVVDYFVHPKQHLKNLFFRTCYLIWEEVTPVFVLEGAAPKLKSQVIAKRNELQFRGVKPKEKNSCSQSSTESKGDKAKGRTRFNHVLKQCENLLQSMGIQCVQAPGEAEAYCAFLNKKRLVDGVISQDSDCFAYGAVRVYRNFSLSSQGAQNAQGGAVDIYDMDEICKKIDFGQHKVIVMGLLCGCDYCPDGIGGVGRDGVLKLFNKYNNKDILKRIRSWRLEEHKYTALEMRVDDKMVCSNCGHMGRTQSHTKNGCGICHTVKGCDASLWKEERLSLKAELMLRKKALSDPTFPSEEIIHEFLSEPEFKPDINLAWSQPNIIKFIKQIGNLLQWPEIYSFQKFLPILTRYQIFTASKHKNMYYVHIKEIIKHRTVRGVASLEVVWEDSNGFFNGLIPDIQLTEYKVENNDSLQGLWTTIEPLNLLQTTYPEIIESFILSKVKPQKSKALSKKSKRRNKEDLIALGNFDEMRSATEDIANKVKAKRKPKVITKTNGIQTIEKFFKTNTKNIQQSEKVFQSIVNCSTPKTKTVLLDLDSDCDNVDFNMSDIVNNIVKRSHTPVISTHAGHALQYESIRNDVSILLKDCSVDDLDLMAQKRLLSLSQQSNKYNRSSKRISLDDSYDMLVNCPSNKFHNLLARSEHLINSSPVLLDTHVQRFKQKNQFSFSRTSIELDSSMKENVSYFFEESAPNGHKDSFERVMENCSTKRICDDYLLISDSENES